MMKHPPDRAELSRLWNDGVPAAKIASMFGYASKACVYTAVRRLGLPPRAEVDVNERRNRDMLADYHRGMTCGEIAKAYNLSRSRAIRIIQQMLEQFPDHVAANGRVVAFSASPQAIARALAKMERRA